MSTASELSSQLLRVAERDAAAFKFVYNATSPKLYGIILRILKRRDLADEVLQEVYVKIWDRASDFNPAIASPITWMSTIARNRALDEARRKRPDSIEDYPQLVDIPADDPSALMIVMRGEDGRRLADCLSQLDLTRRQMVVLAYCDGLSRDELALKYAQPVNTVKTWLRRSLSQLKGCLGS